MNLYMALRIQYKQNDKYEQLTSTLQPVDRAGSVYDRRGFLSVMSQ